ncbi:exodeoxyribonuclease VII large subunit, partial [Paracidovorax cattleyae]|uniref:exodeoxyribonuclease VII large subunit n=1 Tax=Paracidovorax cattleyae TaxID=80868 RepID=UPI001A138EDE
CGHGRAGRRLSDSLQRQLDGRHQRLDMAAQRLGRPSGLIARQELRLARLAQQLRHGAAWTAQRCVQRQDGLADRLSKAVAQGVARQVQRMDHAALRLELLDPRLVLQRGYALLTDSEGLPVTRTAQVRAGDAVRAAVSDGEIDLTVSAPRLL